MTLRLLLVLCAVMAAACVSCGADDDSSEPEDGGPPADKTAPDDEPGDGRRQGGELRLAAPLPESIDPHSPGLLSAADLMVTRLLYRGLYWLDKENNPVSQANGIAASAPLVSDGGRTVTVRLNEGLEWSDGDDLRAEDFVAGVIRSCNPSIASSFQYLLSNVVGCDEFFFADPATADLEALQSGVGVRAVDALTVEFTLREQQVTFPIILTLGVSYPVPVHLERFANATAASPGEWGTDPAELAYNGPYLMQSFAEEQIVFAANPNWSGSVQPTLDAIVMRDVVGPGETLDLFRSGAIEATADLVSLFEEQPETLQTLASEFGDQYAKVAVSTTFGLAPQLESPPLDSLDVRLALARAIDREALNQAAAGGVHQATTSWIPASTSGVPLGTYDGATGYNPDAARAHLAAAGYPDGAGFPSLSLLILEGRPRAVPIAEFLHDAFRSVLNINLEIESVPEDAFDQQRFAGQFELTLNGWATDYPDVENWILGIFNSDGYANLANCSDPEIDRLVSEALLSTDSETRRRLYVEAEELAMTRVCGITPFWHEAAHYLVSTEAVGLLENISASDIFIAGDNAPEAWGLRAE